MYSYYCLYCVCMYLHGMQAASITHNHSTYNKRKRERRKENIIQKCSLVFYFSHPSHRRYSYLRPSLDKQQCYFYPPESATPRIQPRRSLHTHLPRQARRSLVRATHRPEGRIPSLRQTGNALGLRECPFPLPFPLPLPIRALGLA